MIREQGVNHRRHGDYSKEEGGDECRPVAEIQHPNCESSKDNGEVEPGEKSTLIGEEDLGLNSGR